MGRRDYRHRESKKPKKGTRKLSAVTILPTSIAEVEVIKKERKKPEEGEEEEEG